ncbi:DUF5615 family PIN-like protein [uncultured Hymenobacter sp.]|uniref:DUF5615 family PIN-like protein n=1 Tax=uncultured Hymenobacter sp. TaxID=170016 RepID=UPI0035C964E6
MANTIQFLIDANLPVQVFDSVVGPCEALPDLKWSDSRIWQYAVDNQLFIITKDADFGFRVMQQTTLRVVMLCIGNMKRRDLMLFLNRVWPEVRVLCERTTKRLIKVFPDRIEVS